MFLVVIRNAFFCSPFQANKRAERVLFLFLLIVWYRLKHTRMKEVDLSNVCSSSYLLPDVTVQLVEK